jgi:hypothetical protein
MWNGREYVLDLNNLDANYGKATGFITTKLVFHIEEFPRTSLSYHKSAPSI